MEISLTCTIVPGREQLQYQGLQGDTFEDALLALGFIPDTVLLFHNGISLPQDKPIEEEAVEIILTASRG